jgi:hypothetical protein
VVSSSDPNLVQTDWPAPRSQQIHLPRLLVIVLGTAITLCIRGYQFGESNHAVYLLDALRHLDPQLLANDWWTRSTLQYHVAFTYLSAFLIRIDIIEPAFLIGYLALAILLHGAWHRITLRLGGSDGTYLLSVILYYFLAGGVGLGMYQFLQDSAFLPSNISNVAMLWGFYFWITRRPMPAGIWLGVAGLFHLNYALFVFGLWIGLTMLEKWHRLRSSDERQIQPTLFRNRRYWIGTIFALGLSIIAILPALQATLHRSGSIPLSEFVSLYVRLRHPHHYDPSTWGWGLWLSFLVPIVISIPAYRLWQQQQPNASLQRAGDICLMLIAVLMLAIIEAGIWYVNETLIQMSLYRFSIFLKLFSCIAVAYLLVDRRLLPRRLLIFFTALILIASALLLFPLNSSLKIFEQLPLVASNILSIGMFLLLASVGLLMLIRPMSKPTGKVMQTITILWILATMALSWEQLGIRVQGLRDDEVYLAACQWVRENTPVDAVFLVPPNEQAFRLHARRAIVINYKSVPQLSAEIPHWRDRLQDVLQLDDIRKLPSPMDRTLAAIRERYASLPADHLIATAHKYGSRYLLTLRPLPTSDKLVQAFQNGKASYFLYDLSR